MVSTMKYYYGMNHCKERDKIINKTKGIVEYPTYSKKETWQYMVQCKKTTYFRIEFIVKMNKKLKKVQLEEISNVELKSIANNIWWFLRNEEEEMETNQVGISIKHLFRGVIIKNWTGTNFGTLLKHVEMNRIIIKHCIEYFSNHGTIEIKNYMI